MSFTFSAVRVAEEHARTASRRFTVKGRAFKLQFRAWLVVLGCTEFLAACAHKDLVRKNYIDVADD